MAVPETSADPAPEQLDYLLRRAEQESIAAIRSIDPRAAEPHEEMAFAYSAAAVSLLGESAGETDWKFASWTDPDANSAPR